VTFRGCALGSADCFVLLLVSVESIRHAHLDIRCINWKELKRNGYVGVVIDKDNCIV
jgi:hypothetical protein